MAAPDHPGFVSLEALKDSARECGCCKFLFEMSRRSARGSASPRLPIPDFEQYRITYIKVMKLFGQGRADLMVVDVTGPSQIRLGCTSTLATMEGKTLAVYSVHLLIDHLRQRLVV